jgi:hypothetical protein
MAQFPSVVNANTNGGAPACQTAKKAVVPVKTVKFVKSQLPNFNFVTDAALANYKTSLPSDELVADATPKSSVKKQTCRSDPFAIRDGHYVGHDGFVVPKDFDEFDERFPSYVHIWVRKQADRTASKEDLEDWTQDLLIHLLNLPQTSKYREAGKNDIIQTFDPVKHYGANQARFRNYVNLCLANKFGTMRSKRMKDVLCRRGNLSLRRKIGREDPRSVSDEYCHEHSAFLQNAANTSQKQIDDRVFLQKFIDFVRREDPKALSTIKAIFTTGTQADAAEWLGITESEFCRTRNRLNQLAKCFLSGEPVPKQRRPYKKRTAKINQPPGSRLAA